MSEFDDITVSENIELHIANCDYDKFMFFKVQLEAILKYFDIPSCIEFKGATYIRKEVSADVKA